MRMAHKVRAAQWWRGVGLVGSGMGLEVDGVGEGGREGGWAEMGRRPLERVRGYHVGTHL